jgi:hypothetical protein
LTFYTDTTTTQVINDGPMRVIDRKGTLTSYKDSAPNGNFADAYTFRDGTPASSPVCSSKSSWTRRQMRSPRAT